MTGESGAGTPRVSVVTPAFNESANLPVLYQHLVQVMNGLGDWEWIVIDDHSRDATFQVIQGLAAADRRVHGVRLARNSGSHLALACGLKAARGECAVLLAADMQDPPETVPALLEKWQAGAHVVWAVRAKREGVKAHMLWVSHLYYWIMRRVIGLTTMPPTGADFFLLDRRVIDVFREFQETNVSLLALIVWMGFRQEYISYVKQARLHGTTGWTLKKMLKLLADSVTSFSEVPIRLMSYTGLVISGLGLVDAVFEGFRAFTGWPGPSWGPLLAALLIVGGLQILAMGVLGEYVWRALDESRQRPRFLIEDATREIQSIVLDRRFMR
jgi:polyisoprenyl-phosphate glycosyltransferase